MAIQDFTAGQILTAAQMDNLQANDYNQTVSTKTANYTLVAADKGTRVVMNAAGATTITVNTSLFSAGDTLQLQNIGAGVTTVTAGTATVSSAGPLAIPQYGSGTLYFTSAGVAIYFPSAVTVSSAVAQVKSHTLTSTFSGTATLGTFLDVTGLTVTITPTSASNKILLIASVNVAVVNVNGGQGVSAIFTGGNSANAKADTAGNRQRAVSAQISGWTYNASNLSLTFLDAPATTSATTYGIGINYLGDSAGTNTVYVNRPESDPNQTYSSRSSSTITAIEVAP
jgi:hypothetical protein